MNGTEVFLIIIMVLGVLGFIVYKLNQWALVKTAERNDAIAKSRQTVSAFIIDKKRDKLENANLPKNVLEQVGKTQRRFKAYLVKAKIGPQIMTLMCDKPVYEAIQLKKTVKLDIAGIYIVSIKGMKSPEELRKIKKDAKEKAKAK